MALNKRKYNKNNWDRYARKKGIPKRASVSIAQLACYSNVSRNTLKTYIIELLKAVKDKN